MSALRVVSKDHLMNTQDVDMMDCSAWNPTEMDTGPSVE